MAILTTKHHHVMANSFIKDVQDTSTTHYMFVGHPKPWTNTAGGNDDTNVPSANDSVNQIEQDVYNHIVYGKLISNSDVSYVVPRINWTANTIYDQYDQNDGNLFSKNFYVVNDTYDVFKVIDNNKNAKSTIKPSLTTTSGTFMTGDGYTWKYMYTVDAAANTKFTTSEYIPVSTNTLVSNSAVGGTIDAIRVTDGGSNYQIYEVGYLNSFVNNYSVQLPGSSSTYDNHYVGSSIYLKAGYGASQIRNISYYTGSTKRLIVDTPFDSFVQLEVANSQGSISTGQLVTQPIDVIAFLYQSGYFNVGESVVQTNTGASGTIASSNSSIIRILRNTATEFALDYTIRNLNDSGSLKAGRIVTTSGSNTAAAFESVFNTNTSVNNSADSISLGANQYYSNGDYIRYTVPTGNTAIPGLTSNTYYYVVGTNATHIQLSTTSGGSALAINAVSNSQTHTISPVLSSYYSTNDYIRVGADANNQIRRITAVTNNSINVDVAFTQTNSAAQHFKMISAITPTSITKTRSSGYVSNLNINGVKLFITNSLSVGVPFTLGERVLMANSVSNVNIGASGTVSFSNTSMVVLTDVSGTWSTNLFIRGNSSEQKSQISTVVTYPNITLNGVSGTFLSGQIVLYGDIGNTVGNATVVTATTLPNSLTEYVISPRVTITGDGSNAAAYAVVNTDFGSTYPITNFIMIDPGSNYTYANVTVSSNNLYGSNASGLSIISPISGHGFDAPAELGSRYVGVTTTFNTLTNELYTFPGYGSYRTFGIIRDPKYNDVTVNVSSFDRVKINTSGLFGTFINGEIIINAANSTSNLYSNASGICVFSNTSYIELKNVRGTFTNVSSSSNKLYGVSSNAYASISSVSNSHFIVSSNSVVYQETSNANAILEQAISNTQLKLTSVSGLLSTGYNLIQTAANAYANVTSIYIANNTKDVSTVFGNRFNQTMRITLTSNTGSYQLFETVKQDLTNATGTVISTNNEKDLAITMVTGSFSNSQKLVNMTTGANGYTIFANSTYVKLTTTSNTLTFSPGQYINNSLGANALITAVYPVLVLNDVSGAYQFQSGTNNIVGQTSGASGQVSSPDLITYPMLIRDSGEVLYIENVSPITKTDSTQEQVKLVIKF